MSACSRIPLTTLILVSVPGLAAVTMFYPDIDPIAIYPYVWAGSMHGIIYRGELTKLGVVVTRPMYSTPMASLMCRPIPGDIISRYCAYLCYSTYDVVTLTANGEIKSIRYVCVCVYVCVRVCACVCCRLYVCAYVCCRIRDHMRVYASMYMRIE
jgi:hypothetical protein